MANKLSRFTKGAETVYITHHPHLRGLVDSVDRGRLYLPVLSEAVAKLEEKAGVSVLDARNHIIEIHGDAFPSDTYVDDDIFSHLNAEGAVRYGKWIVQQLVQAEEDLGN